MPFYWYHGLPNHTMELNNLESLILNRYQSFNNSEAIINYDLNVNSNDSVGHLFMCIIANYSSHLKPLIMDTEQKLFATRLKTIGSSDIDAVLAGLLNYLNTMLLSHGDNKVNSKSNLQKFPRSKLKLMANLISTVCERSAHVFHFKHTATCRKYKVIVPFTFPLKMVSKREVELMNGKTKISCGQWNQLLESVFVYVLEIELEEMNNNKEIKKAIFEMEDDRIRQIIKKCTNVLTGNAVKDNCVTRAENVDEETKYFPPCMANLHQILRQTHRLSFDSRYQYTLFLKDIGLPVEENLIFWEEQYRKPHLGTNCLHHWEDKQTRYKYQIRHLYGMTGSGISKASHSCGKFIEHVHSKMDGGCPFHQMNKSNLKCAIPHALLMVPDIEDMFKFTEESKPQKACSVYLKCQETRLTEEKHVGRESRMTYWDGTSQITSPLQFYHLAKNISRRLSQNR